MKLDVFNLSTIKKVRIKYFDGRKQQRKEDVTINHIDNKNCFFCGERTLSFSAPGWWAKVEILVYTSQGVYVSTSKILSTNEDFGIVKYKIAKPKEWNLIQLRKSLRKKSLTSVNIQFSDRTELVTEINEINMNGFSVMCPIDLTTVQKKFSATCKINIDESEDKNIKLEACFVRENLVEDENGYNFLKKAHFKITNISNEDLSMLKKYFYTLESA